MQKNETAMPNFRFWLGGAVILLTLLQTACQPNMETVENRDANGRLERFQRRKKDFAKEGLYQRFHEDGHLIEEAHYVNDSLDGERKFFYPNGAVESIEHYRRGIIHGPYQKFYESGQLEIEQAYVDGVLQGLSTAWYKNGVVKEKVTLRDNEENGPFTEWFENGRLKAEGNYVDGDNEDGTLKLYDTLGQLERILECQRGVCHTTWVKEGAAPQQDQ